MKLSVNWVKSRNPVMLAEMFSHTVKIDKAKQDRTPKVMFLGQKRRRLEACLLK